MPFDSQDQVDPIELVRSAAKEALEGIQDYQEYIQAGGASDLPSSTSLLVIAVGRLEDAHEQLKHSYPLSDVPGATPEGLEDAPSEPKMSSGSPTCRDGASSADSKTARAREILIPSDSSHAQRGLSILHASLGNLMAHWRRPGSYEQRPEAPFEFDRRDVVSLRRAIRELDRAAEERAAAEARAAGNGQPRVDTGQGVRTDNAATPAAKPALQPPSDAAMMAYRLKWVLDAPTQAKIANILSKELGKRVSQGQVSRWIAQAEKFVREGGVLPDLPTRPAGKPMAMDPARLDLGPRRDGRTRRQRERRSEED
jgi:hypothetical protein